MVCFIKNCKIIKKSPSPLATQKGLPGEDWAEVLPIQKLLETNQVTPENFMQIGLSVQKLFMIVCRSDAQTHKLHTTWITPLPDTGMGGIFYTPFFYLFTHYVCLLCLLTLFCSDNIISSLGKMSMADTDKRQIWTLSVRQKIVCHVLVAR